MATPLGPRGPKNPTLGQVLPFPTRAKSGDAHPADKTERAQKTSGPVTADAPVEGARTAGPPVDDPATFDKVGGTAQTLATPVEGAGASQIAARLKALGLEGRKRTKTAESGPRIVSTPEGKVLSGSLNVESKSGLQKLDGVVRVGGALTIHEGVVKNADLLALKELKVVEGRLTFEGLRST